MRATGTVDLAERHVEELSGGQRQRVWIALTLAQETDVVLLDEPTTYLDVAHQVDVLDLLRDLNRNHGTTVVMVLHDLNLAARYADHVVALRDGRLVAAGRLPTSSTRTSSPASSASAAASSPTRSRVATRRPDLDPPSDRRLRMTTTAVTPPCC